jgi:hypothetical protein
MGTYDPIWELSENPAVNALSPPQRCRPAIESSPMGTTWFHWVNSMAALGAKPGQEKRSSHLSTREK